MTDAQWMETAIEAARQGIEHGQTPFGAAIVRGDELIVAAHNEVWGQTDITAHAEVVAIRLACRELKTISLRGCRIYTTCEPCPMCMSASHWAGLDRVYFGADVADAAAAGFNELTIPCQTIKEVGQSTIEIVPGLLADRCRQLFAQWKQQKNPRAY